jgi:HEAT repeat protein
MGIITSRASRVSALSTGIIAGVILLSARWVWAEPSELDHQPQIDDQLGPANSALPADEVVYQRYSRKLRPSKIPYEFGMKFTELTHPGTPEDVEKGAAVFTFEGLGSTRVWKLPQCPIFCSWSSLKDFPFPGQAYSNWTNFDNSGYVCQAEELQVNGQWKRYFGFVCKYGAAVVPAGEVYLSFCDCDPVPGIDWTKLPGGTDWGELGPGRSLQQGKIVSQPLSIGDSLPVEVYVRNRRGAPQSVLWELFRDGKSGGPAFHKGIDFILGWAPFAPKTPDRYYPHLEDFKALSPIRTNRFDTAAAGPPVPTGEVVQRAVFDIRDWFNVTVPGYYHYNFEFNPVDLGLPTDEGPGGGVYTGFTVGTEPKRLTFEELNRDIPAFGRSGGEEEIRASITRNLGSDATGSNHVQRAPQSLPPLNYIAEPSDNGPPDEPDVVGLRRANEELLNKLRVEEGSQARSKLEVLMNKEKTQAMKLLLASEAAPLGSQQAALFLLECMKDTDYVTAENTQAALRFAFGHYERNPPDWLFLMAIAALSDERYVTGLQKAGWSGDTRFTISYVADEGGLTDALAYLKCTNAVPFLIEMVRKTNGRRGPVMALGQLGDPRAIPVLIECVKQRGPAVSREKGRVLDDYFLRPIVALGHLHARVAVPLLLEYIEHPEVIEALEMIGDSRAIGPLQKLVLSKGKIEKAGVNNEPALEQERLAAARISLASLSPTDRTAKLCELLTDASFDQYQRRTVVWRLGDHPDPRAIPFLAKAIKTDASGAVVNQSIAVMAAFKYKAAVDALIDCFDSDFRGKDDWKRAYKPEMFRQNLADSLRRLTGQSFGADRIQWQKWWKEHRDTTPSLE